MRKTKLGQHFLKDSSALRLIAKSLDIKSGDFILEVGSGHGELTLPILELAEPVGAEVCSVELDSELVADLAAKTSGRIHIIEGDVRDKLGEAVALAKSRPYKIVGNIPYYLTGYLFRMIGDLSKLPELAIFTVQKEVAERAVAQPPQMNRLAASLGFWSKPKILKSLPKSSFLPPPEVDSAILMLLSAPRRAKNKEAYFEAVRRLFSQPRKTILNNLRGKKRSLAETKGLLESLGLSPNLRPQDLSVENIVAISNLV